MVTTDEKSGGSSLRQARQLGLLSLCATALGVGAFGIGLTWMTDYQVHDADSRLYIALSHELGVRPLRQWCAPVWHGNWGREGLFVEHPPGLFWCGALLEKCGLPPAVALYAVNQIAWLVGLGLLWKISTELASPAIARRAVVLWCLSPGFLQYLVRGDQEHPLATSLLLGLYAVICLRRPAVLAGVWSAALSSALAIKGLPALGLVPIGIVTGYGRGLSRPLWSAVGIGTALALVNVGLFELWYYAEAGRSFLAAYLALQVGPSIGHKWLWTTKLHNIIYYLARPLWFAQPSVGVLVYMTMQRCFARAGRYAGPRGDMAAVLGPLALLLFVLAFAMADRKADRYLFATYPLLALSAAVALDEHLCARARAMRQRAAPGLHDCALGALAITIAIGIKVYLGGRHYVFIRLWPGA